MPLKRTRRGVQGRPRRNVIDDSKVGVYHVWVRCVRQAYLCGTDPDTGQDFEHRKAWLFERLEHLARIFAIDACVWAILGSHYHLILRNRPDLVSSWSDEEVVRRWWMLCPERKDDEGRALEPTDLEIRSILAYPQKVAEYRRRLGSVSCFMKYINEWFARRANKEDGARGHFWEERFRARNLLDEGAILACSIYIDLNEIRAELAATPEDSPNTSAYRRILARVLREARALEDGTASLGDFTDYDPDDPDFWMCPVNELDRAPLLAPVTAQTNSVENSDTPILTEPTACPAVKPWRHGFLPVTADQYLELLDWTGRQLAAGKRGHIDVAYPPILERIGLRPGAWLDMISEFETWFHGAVGRVEGMVDQAARTGRNWIQGVRRCRDAFT